MHPNCCECCEKHLHSASLWKTVTSLNAAHHILLVLVLVNLPLFTQQAGYSYSRFRGPVQSPEHKIFGHGGKVDYVARPKYEFAYGVEDGLNQVLQNHKESRDDDEVRGVYR